MTVALPLPDHVLVIGGGRWARVIVGALAEILPANVRLSLQTVHNAALARNWLESRGLLERISIIAARPEPEPGLAVIVANAVRDHAESARWALEHRLPTLVEKPLTPYAAETAALVDFANANKVMLCAAHVFLFSPSVQDFLKLAKAAGPFDHIQLRWTDAPAETRHGETKSYDPGVPLHVDCLPHVLSLLTALLEGPVEVTDLEVARGGASESIVMRIGQTPVIVELERNAAGRQRRLEARTDHGAYILDFSSEPGTILRPNSERPLTPLHPESQGPLAAMLHAFLIAAAGAPCDPRLAAETGYQANLAADSVSALYHPLVWSWTAEQLSVSANLADADLRYRLTEELQANRPRSSADLAAKMAAFMQRHAGESAARLWLAQRMREI